MVYALKMFRHYLLGGHLKIFMAHSSLQYLVNNPMLGGMICRWLLIFQEFNFEIIVKLGWMNDIPHHLSHIETGEEPTNIDDGLSDA